jgi:antitoxin component of MazEF toxin-antitoxin module
LTGTSYRTGWLDREAHMVAKLVKQGDSFSLVLDKSLVERMNIDPSEELNVTLDGSRRLIITPVAEPVSHEEFRKVLEQVNATHGGTLKRLAE